MSVGVFVPLRAEASSLDYAECSRKCQVREKAAPVTADPLRDKV